MHSRQPLSKRMFSDRGSVLVLGLGFIGVLLLALSVVIDASLALIQRSTLQARADAAVLAGVQAIDLDTYYAHGATSATRLVPQAARVKVVEHFERSQRSAAIPDAQVLSITADGSYVETVFQAPARLVFWPVEALITVKAAAQLDYVG